MKLLITADWHLGTSDGHDEDIRRGCEEIHEYATKHNILTLIHAGDEFEIPRPTPDVYKKFADCLEIIGMRENFVISGNHTATLKYSSLDAYDSSFLLKDDTYFMSTVTTIKLDDVQFIFAPFVPSEDFGMTVYGWVRDILDTSRASKRILVTHTDIPGAKFAAEREVQLGDVGTLPAIKGIDFIISGHIHKHQSGTIGGVPYLYPGSLARASHSEEKEPKGFVVLETDDFSWKFIKRKTARKWVTVNCEWNGKMPTLPATTKGADVIRLNVNAADKYRNVINRVSIEKDLQSKFQQVKLNVTYNKKAGTESHKTVSKTSSFVEYEKKWLDLNAKGMKEAVRKKMNKLLGSVKVSDGSKQYHGLVLKEYDISNYQSIANASRKFGATDCVGILGLSEGDPKKSNGTGKSTYVEGIRWILYGNTRFSKNASAVMDNAESATGHLVLSSAGKHVIEIERQQTSTKSEAYVHVDGKMVAKGRQVTEWVVDNLGLNLKAFDSIIFIGGSNHPIVGSKNTERMMALQAPLPLEKYKRALDKTKAERSAKKTEYDRLQGIISEFEITESDEEDYKTSKENLAKITKDIAVNAKDVKRYRELVKKLNAQLTAASVLEERQLALEGAEEELESFEIEMTNVQKMKPAKSKSAVVAEIKKLESEIKKQMKVLKDIEEKGVAAKTRVQLITEEKQMLTDAGEVCPVCSNKLESHVINHTIYQKTQAIDALTEDIKKYKHEYRVVHGTTQNLDSKLKELTVLVSDWDTYAKDVKYLSERITKAKEKVKSAKSKIAIEEKKIIQPINIEDLESRIEEYEDALEECENYQKTLESDRAECLSTISSIEKARASLQAAAKKSEIVAKEMEVLNLCNAALSPKGIPKFITMSIVEEINDAIPATINQFGFWQPIDIRLESDDEQISLWAKIGNKNEREYEGLSAGQKQMVNFIVVMAYRSVLENIIDISYSFVVIDEALDQLDETNLPAAIKYFKRAKMQAFCISHSNLKDSFTKTVLVNNNNGVAEVI